MNYFFVFILTAVIFETVADIFLKNWSVNSKGLFLTAGLVFYIVGTLFWAYSLKFQSLSKAISIFTVLNLIVIILVGLIFFKENVSTINKIGILFGVVSVILMEL